VQNVIGHLAKSALTPILLSRADISSIINSLGADSIANSPLNSNLGTIIELPGEISGLAGGKKAPMSHDAVLKSGSANDFNQFCNNGACIIHARI